MADKIKFLAGKLADLQNKPKVQGQVYFAIDGETGKIAFDVDGQTRVFMDKASSADSATQDSAGNVISQYFKKIELLEDNITFQFRMGNGGLYEYEPKKTGIRLNFVSRAGDTMTGLLTAKGGILVNTATNTNNFIISRNGSATSECTTFGQNDQGLVIKSINDEASTFIRFEMEATDMESNAGAGKNSGTITFGLSGGKTTVTADYFSGQASSAVKDSYGNTIASTFIKNLVLGNHATQPYYTMVKGNGDDKTTVNLPVADAENAGVVTVGAQSFKGQKTFIYSDTTTAKKSSAIVLNANGKSPTGIEFYRGDAADAASWQIVNHGGNFIFRTDYSDTVQTTYNVESLKLHYTTGAAQVPYLWVNPTSTQSGYRLYVNGNSYLNGKITITGATTLASTLGFSGDYYTPNRMMWTNAGNVVQAAYHFVNSTQVAINSTSVPSANFYVNGTSGFSGNIDIWAGDEDRYITFGYTPSAGYDWRIGYIGSGSGDANYLAFQSSKTDGKYVNALRLGLTTLDAAFGGNVYPLDGSTGEQYLGTSANRWPYIYGVIGNFSSTVTATTFIASTENALSTSGVMRIKSGSTMYLNRGASTSLIFQLNGSGHARFDTAGHFIPEADNTYNIGSSSQRWKNVYATTVNGVLKTDNIVLQNAAAQYGRLYIATEGTACATAGTAGTTGVAMLILGNSTAVSSTAGEGANNARGRIRLYGTGANYIQLQAAPKTETNNYSFTLPPYEGNMYAAHTGSTDAVGSGVKPVYVGASGRITASSSTVGSGIKPIYLNAGTLTVSSSTVGSGIIPVFLNAGTLTASTSTIGSGIKPMFLSAGTLTASSSTVGSGVVPMFLSAGTLTASTSTVGSGIKPIYLNAGTLTVSSSTVGTSDRPVYLSSGTISQTTYRMAATNATATSGVDIGSTPQTGIWYVSGTSSILGQSDGVAIVNHYNSNWVSQIYQDYRTGQIALRGKNNGTWQSWRTVIDTGNYTTHLDGRYVNVTGDSMSGTLSWGGNIASLNLRTGHADYDGVISYQTSGNEAFLFTTKNAVTSFIFANGEDTITNMAADRWTKITPALQIKNNCVYIGSLIANGSTPSYKFYVNGTSYFNGAVTTAGLLTVSTGSSHSGIKMGTTYVTSISGDVIFQNNGAIRFGTDDWDYNCWAGLKYVHSSKTISLGLADGSTFTANAAQSGGTVALPGIRYFSVNGKTVIDANDSWLRINETKAFSSGIYCGSNVLRTDYRLEVGSSGAYFYAENSGNGYFSKSLGIAGTNTTYNLYVNGTAMVIGALGSNSQYIIKPQADYRTTTSTVTGAITIVLPASIGNTMVSMWIDVYDYRSNTSFSVHCGGYTYNNSTWANSPFAMVYGADHTVRLGHNGTNFVIYIGETSASWSYPQVSVRDVIVGYTPTYTNWIKTWSITFSTTFSNVTSTHTQKAITSKNIASQSVNYANYSGYATYLSSNTKMTYGWNGLNYFNATMAAGGAAGVNDSPTADWYHVIRMNHANANGYYFDIASCFHNNNMYFKRVASGTSSGWKHIWVEGNSVTGAVWNDYAECRKATITEAGYVLYEVGDDSLDKTYRRLQPFAGVSSDTWGFSQGQTDEARTHIAVAGRVLVYPYQDRNNYQPGDCVCAAPGGTVDIMTREEIIEYPDRIVGTVSCVPDYETWGGGEGADREPVKVNGRIWIKVK